MALTRKVPRVERRSILTSRLGRELVERLVDPLLGVINAGGLDQLSLSSWPPRWLGLSSAIAASLAL